VGFVLATGAILLAFTLTSSTPSVTPRPPRHGHPAGAPIVTTVLLVTTQGVAIPPVRWLGLALVLAAVTVVVILGNRRESRAA